MKTRFFSVIIMLFMAVTTYSQEQAGGSEQVSTLSEKTDKKKGGVYYLQITGGGNFSQNENVRKGKFGDALGWGADIAIGREFTPYWSADVMAAFNTNVLMFGEKFDVNNYGKFKSGEVFLNGALNLTNALGGFKENRKANLYLYAGVGGAYSFDYGARHRGNELTYALRAGLNYTHSISSRWALVGNIGWSVFGDKFNSIVNGVPLDSRLNLQIGVRYRCGKNLTRWTPNPKVEYVERLVERTDTVRIVERVVEKVTTEIPMQMQTIYFQINSSKILDEEIAKISQLADYLKSHPDKAVLVIGSADRNTGDENTNKSLRANRASAVAKMLNDKFGIDKARIKTLMGKGEKEDIYRKEYEKNRAAICIIVDFNEE